MKNYYKVLYAICLMALLIFCICGCGNRNEKLPDTQEATESDALYDNTETVETEEETIVEDEAEEVDNTIDADVIDAGADSLDATEENADSEEAAEEMVVDLIMFMGQSNMSGCGGDASLAPQVPEEAGLEFRAVSDPTKLYPIREPFGINENNLNGLLEKPGGKKGSLVSSFVNEYYAATGTKVIAVSASRGETDMDKWLSEDIMLDVVTRYLEAQTYLNDNGYTIRHKYIVWLQGESDALKRLSQDAYKTKLDDFIRPFFMKGMEKVFIITPGRTIDETEIYTNIIKSQLDMCKHSGYYGLATSVLSGVSCEYMNDLYHYNQHVLNMVGMEAAKSVAYYSNTGHEMVLYDYKNKEQFVPDGSEDYIGEAFGPIDLSNLNERY